MKNTMLDSFRRGVDRVERGMRLREARRIALHQHLWTLPPWPEIPTEEVMGRAKRVPKTRLTEIAYPRRDVYGLYDELVGVIPEHGPTLAEVQFTRMETVYWTDGWGHLQKGRDEFTITRVGVLLAWAYTKPNQLHGYVTFNQGKTIVEVQPGRMMTP